MDFLEWDSSILFQVLISKMQRNWSHFFLQRFTHIIRIHLFPEASALVIADIWCVSTLLKANA
jgi:hypothetical protein